MAQPCSRPSLSPKEYLAIERQAETRSEYLGGEMLATAGGSYAHNVIVGNLIGEIRQQLKGRPCTVCPGGQRVLVPEVSYTYPDIVVVCGDPRFEDKHFDTLLNPVLIVEIVSPTTEAYDRGKKFHLYQKIESLVEYVLVAQDENRVERFLRRENNQWLLTPSMGLESTVSLTSIQCALPLAEVYDKVEIG
jgi:Uma2 family endonuclease